MRTISIIPTLTFATALALGAVRLGAADGTVKYESQPGSTVKIDGTSTIHDWTTIGRVIGGAMEIDAEFDANLKAPKTTPKVEIVIPVRQLKSTVAVGASKMDQVMQEHMNMKQYPRIEFKLLELAPKSEAGQFDAKGALTVSGVTKTNAMTVTIARVDGKLKVSGSTNLKMTDFNIKPPAPEVGLGMIKTGDDVKISFEWLTAKAQ